MTPVWAAAMIFVLLHYPGGGEVSVNIKKIVAMKEGKEGEPNKLYTDEVHCLLNMEDGRNITVVESCDEVKRLIAEEEKKNE